MLIGSLNLGRETRGLIARCSVNQFILDFCLFLWLVGSGMEGKGGNQTREAITLEITASQLPAPLRMEV